MESVQTPEALKDRLAENRRTQATLRERIAHLEGLLSDRRREATGDAQGTPPDTLLPLLPVAGGEGRIARLSDLEIRVSQNAQMLCQCAHQVSQAAQRLEHLVNTLGQVMHLAMAPPQAAPGPQLHSLPAAAAPAPAAPVQAPAPAAAPAAPQPQNQLAALLPLFLELAKRAGGSEKVDQIMGLLTSPAMQGLLAPQGAQAAVAKV